jgi:MFS family permease
MRAEIREGLAALLGHPVLRAIVITAAMFVLLFSAQLAIFLLYLSRDLHLEPFAIGFLLAIGSIGALVGALSAPTITRRIGIGPTFVFGGVLVVAWLIGRGLIAEPQGVAVISVAAAQLIGLLGFSIVNVSGPSLRQALTPPHLLGRVNASYRFLVWGTGPFGALLGGTLGELFGLRAALLITGIASVVILPILFASPVPLMREVPNPEATPA